jgi:hypothetical protein
MCGMKVRIPATAKVKAEPAAQAPVDDGAKK